MAATFQSPSLGSEPEIDCKSTTFERQARVLDVDASFNTPVLEFATPRHHACGRPTITTSTSSADLDLDWNLIPPVSDNEHTRQNLPRRKRGGLLGAASGALASRISRRKPGVQARPPSRTEEPALSEGDAERAEEQDRLRHAADGNLGWQLGLPGSMASEQEYSGDDEGNVEETAQKSQASVPPALPAFPATKASLASAMVLQAVLPKYYPAALSLRRVLLEQQWASRAIVFTGPSTTGDSPSHLHVFRIGDESEHELERLAIDEQSVMFVADEVVGGRARVVKVGGRDVGAHRPELNGEEFGLTMLWLQIVDAQESRAWIGAIKAAVLKQRFEHIDFCSSYDSSWHKPCNNLDAVLSTHMQGMDEHPTSKSELSPSRLQVSTAPSSRGDSPRPATFLNDSASNESCVRVLSHTTSNSDDDPGMAAYMPDSFSMPLQSTDYTSAWQMVVRREHHPVGVGMPEAYELMTGESLVDNVVDSPDTALRLLSMSTSISSLSQSFTLSSSLSQTGNEHAQGYDTDTRYDILPLPEYARADISELHSSSVEHLSSESIRRRLWWSNWCLNQTPES